MLGVALQLDASLTFSTPVFIVLSLNQTRHQYQIVCGYQDTCLDNFRSVKAVSFMQHCVCS